MVLQIVLVGSTLLGTDGKRKLVICAVRVVSALGALSPPWSTTEQTLPPANMVPSLLVDFALYLLIYQPLLRLLSLSKLKNKMSTARHTHSEMRRQQASEAGTGSWPHGCCSCRGGEPHPTGCTSLPSPGEGKLALSSDIILSRFHILFCVFGHKVCSLILSVLLCHLGLSLYHSE